MLTPYSAEAYNLLKQRGVQYRIDNAIYIGYNKETYVVLHMFLYLRRRI